MAGIGNLPYLYQADRPQRIDVAAHSFAWTLQGLGERGNADLLLLDFLKKPESGSREGFVCVLHGDNFLGLQKLPSI